MPSIRFTLGPFADSAKFELMSPSVITFDCAQTLVDATWDPVQMLKDAAAGISLECRPEEFALFGVDVQRAWPQLCGANASRNVEAVDQLWFELTEDWLSQVGRDRALAVPLKALSDTYCFKHPSKYFTLYDDVIPSLTRLQLGGYRLAVISNWDRSLPWILEMFGLTGFFEVASASLVEGVEKPDRRLFELTLEKMGVEPSDAVHVGDDKIDDIAGAHGAGMEAVLIDRSRSVSAEGVIHSLAYLEEAMAWNG